VTSAALALKVTLSHNSDLDYDACRGTEKEDELRFASSDLRHSLLSTTQFIDM
jgi:hypothetical protein